MKFKIMDKEPIYLAGVVHYGPLTKANYSGNNKVNGIDIEFDFEDEDFKRNIRDLKENAKVIQAQIADEVKFHTDHFGNDYKEHRRRWKEEAKEAARHAKEAQRKYREETGYEGPDPDPIRGEGRRTDSEGNYAGNFEGAIKRFGDVMESLGKHVKDNAGNWEAGIKDWSQNFERNMEDFGRKMDAWGEDFGSKMEAWGEDFGKRMEEWGESFGSQWEADFDENDQMAAIRRYPIYRTYEDIYDRYMKDHPDHIKKQTFYEVQIMDTTFEDVASMVMIGSRMESLADMRYPVATMVFEPDKWVAVKLSKEEYAKDWLGSLEKVEQLQNYHIEPYFIIRHRKESGSGEIRLFCPIREKADE